MIILSDTDVVQKLAYCELLLDFLQLINCPPNQVWVLPQLAVMMRRKLVGTSEALRNFEQFLTRVKNIPKAEVATLERFDSLDPGERQLLSILCDQERVKHLVTGDKKALDKIAALTHGDTQLKTRLEETSIYCFEAVMLGLLAKRGFSIVQARVHNKWVVVKGQDVDKVVLRAFPPRGDAKFAQKVLEEELARLKVSIPLIQFETA